MEAVDEGKVAVDVVDGEKEETEEHPQMEAGQEGKIAEPESGKEEKPLEGSKAEVEEVGNTGKEDAMNADDEAKEETTEPMAGGLVGDVAQTDGDAQEEGETTETKRDAEAAEEGQTGKDEAGNADDETKKEEQKASVDETAVREEQLSDERPVDDVKVVPQPTGMQQGRYMTQLAPYTASC